MFSIAVALPRVVQKNTLVNLSGTPVRCKNTIRVIRTRRMKVIRGGGGDRR